MTNKFQSPIFETPSPHPSPLGGEGKGEGRLFEIGIWSLFGFWDFKSYGLCARRFAELKEEVTKREMAVSMRLMRFGRKKNPFYRIVVSDRRTPRDGSFIDQVGTYDPKKDPAEVRFKEEKAIEWLRKGAQPTPTVRQLLIRSGVSKKLAEGKIG
jgi:small subunit ribosomal protein S16